MDTSERGRAFIYAHEGNPSTVYLDPVGKATVGPGLAEHNPVVKRMLGKLKPGTVYPPEQLDRVFAAVLDEYVEPAIETGMPGAKQHEFDAGASALYNLGKGAIEWQWATLWRAGKKKEAADYLGSHYNTAGGKKLPGLERRRKEEAKLLEFGVYTGIDKPDGVPRSEQPEPAKRPDKTVREAQELLTARGFDPGAIDGWLGPKTKAALIAYQKAHPHLKADGILGMATLSQLRRDAQAVKDAVGKGGGVATGAGILSAIAGLPWGWMVAGAVALAIAYFAWRYRDVIARRINTLRGREVVV